MSYAFVDPAIAAGAHPRDALPFDAQIVCHDSWLDPLIQGIVKELQASSLKANISKAQRRCMGTIIANLFKGALAGKPVSVSRDKNTYKVPERYNPNRLTYGLVVLCLDRLEDVGLIGMKKGNYDRTKRTGYRTRIWATETLLDIFKVHCPLVGPATCTHERAEIIRLKDSEKHLIDFPETKSVQGMRKRLNKINFALEMANIDLPGATHIPKDEKRLYRVFNNGSFEQGGRFYGGWWQNLSEEDRKQILIDGYPTIERDFGGMHIRMLYAREAKLDYSDDPYLLVEYGVTWRDAFKKVLLICLSADSRNSAMRAIQQDKLENPTRYPPNFNPKEALEKFLIKHSRIAHVFFDSDVSRDLQFEDSQIAEEIMLKLIGKGIVVLPIHDSFIVARKNDEDLQEAMRDTFKGKTEVSPVIHAFFARWTNTNDRP